MDRPLAGRISRASSHDHRFRQRCGGGAGGSREADEQTGRLRAVPLQPSGRHRKERGDIDIIAIAPSGVFVVDPKAYRGKKVRTNRKGDTFIVNGRRRTQLASGMRRHLDAVADAVAQGPIPNAPDVSCVLLHWRRPAVGTPGCRRSAGKDAAWSGQDARATGPDSRRRNAQAFTATYATVSACVGLTGVKCESRTQSPGDLCRRSSSSAPSH